ncbi:hypothetical protein GGI12_002338 [Dipsacomyces acuminosporus]|nr:hypothetical protein GGI12_002338 [Dipsacomyces acuminosporus]
MTGTKNINWQIGLLEARTGKGASFKRAKQVEVKRKRLEEKAQKAQKAKQQPVISNSIAADEQAEKQLHALRIEKTKTKLHHVKRTVRSALKKIKSSEVQKATRQLKNAQKARDEADKDKVDEAAKTAKQAEELLAQIKAVDLDAAVLLIVHRIRKKSRAINSALVDTADTSASQTLNDDKAMQRVINAKQMAELVKQHINELEALLNGAQKPRQPTEMPQPTKHDAESSGRESDGGDTGSDQEESDGVDEYDSGADDYESTSDLDAYSENVDELHRSKKAKGNDDESMFVGSLGDFVSDDNISGSEYDSESDGGSNKKKNDKLAKKQKQEQKQKKGRANVDYDEEADDAFDKLYGANAPKNRPGQRARRAMYEKKYGKEANHIKILTKDKKPKREAAERPYSSGKRSSSNKSSSGSAEPVHPSWEAKRRERQMLASAPKSQKVVFGDDGNAIASAEAPAAATGKKNTQPAHLHPSWEAKRRQKEALEQAKQVKGTKILFD